jgi:regulator of protease activity HflC (stomatin/prohibitin superfamily)
MPQLIDGHMQNTCTEEFANTCCCCGQIQTSEIGIIERCGKFKRNRGAGCVFLCWPFERLAEKISLRVQEININCETKTKDNVFVLVKASVQFKVVDDSAYQAAYILMNVEQQMRCYIYDVIRSEIPLMTLDDAFSSKDEVSEAIKNSLKEVMGQYGYEILNSLITDLTPDIRVKNAMNEINASKRLKESAYQKAEGEKVLKVKRAEAESESMYLSGVGVARQRGAIMDGLKDSINHFSECGTTGVKDVMDLLVLNQYFDTLHEVGTKGNSKIILTNKQMNVEDDSIRKGMMEANASLGF